VDDLHATHLPADQLARLEETLWVTQARAGDSDALIHLIKRYERPLLYYLRRLVPKPEDALDVHQEIWVAVARALPSLEAPEAFRVWLYRIAHHKAARFIRNEIRREQFQAPAVTEIHDATAPSPQGSAGNAEAIHSALGFLPPHQREILTLHYLNDLSTAEIGRVLDCPPGTVKSRLHHARLALRQIMERKNL
jgi:RNA polymerase sigma-70 factor, ECF subfamily